MYGDLPVIMIDALYCRSTAVLLAMHVWLYVVAVLYMVSDRCTSAAVRVRARQGAATHRWRC